jgi:hypothetical protein
MKRVPDNATRPRASLCETREDGVKFESRVRAVPVTVRDCVVAATYAG